MKMPTIVGIFIYISRENFMLSWAEHEKSFKPRGSNEETNKEVLCWNTEQQNCYER